MAVVTKYGNGYPVPGGMSVAAVDAEAGVRAIFSKIAVANGDSGTSKLYLGRVPSNARILPMSLLYYTAITGLNSLDVGIGSSVNCLLAAKDVTSAGSAGLMGAVVTGNQVKKAWELAGLTADPGGMLDVIATMNAAATAAGSLEAHILYAKG